MDCSALMVRVLWSGGLGYEDLADLELDHVVSDPA
jgi:hypothetical protein